MSNKSSPMMETNNPKFKKAVELIKHSKLYDKEYYLENNQDIMERGIDPLTHYLFYGFKEKRNPSETFDNEFYLNFYGDVKRAGINPLVHYIIFGEKEGRIYNEKQRKALEKENKPSFKEVQDKITRPLNKLNYLTEDTYKNVVNKNPEMKETWIFHEDIIKHIKQLTNIKTVLEINPYKTPLVIQSDILDSTDKYLKEYPIEINNFYYKNLNHTPFPVEDKKYDLALINNDFDELNTIEEYQKFFNEIQRISKSILIVLPYKTFSMNKSINNIDEEIISTWLNNLKYEYQILEDDRIIRYYKFQ